MIQKKTNFEEDAVEETHDIKELEFSDETESAESEEPIEDFPTQTGVQLSTYESPVRKKLNPPVKTPRRVENWTMPKMSLLDDPPDSRIKIDEKEIRRKAEITLDKLKQFSKLY